MRRTFRLALVALAVGLALPVLAQQGIYTASVSGELVVGKDGQITLTIVPGKGMKWNKEYPAKLLLTAVDKDSRVSLPKTEYTKAGGGITGDEKAGRVTIAVRGLKAGQAALEGTMSFSICDAETCHVLRKRKIPMTVTVK